MTSQEVATASYLGIAGIVFCSQPQSTVLNSGNSPSLLKFYWDATGGIEFCA
jgi:hypothetical protein